MGKDLRTVALVAGGVLVAGYVMALFGTAPFITDARRGFTGA